MTASLADTLLLAEANLSIKHDQLISWYQRHMLLKRVVLTAKLGQRVQRASLIGQIERERWDFYHPEYRDMGKHRSHDSLTPRHLLIAVYGYYDIVFQTENKKVIDVCPKVTSCSFNIKGTVHLICRKTKFKNLKQYREF